MNPRRPNVRKARIFVLSTWVGAALVNVGCRGILGIEDPLEPAVDAASTGVTSTENSSGQEVDASAQGVESSPPSIDSPAQSVDATAGVLDAAPGENVELSGGDAEAPELDGAPITGADVEAGPMLNPCAGAFDGQYCGSDGNQLDGFNTSGTDPNTLYTCTNHVTTSAVVCPHGCMINSVIEDDTCVVP